MIHVRNWWIVPSSIIIALILERLPLHYQLAMFMPSWISLVIIYWSTFLKNHFSVVIAFLIGLIVDVYVGDSLGQNGLVYACLSFLARSQSKRLSTAPMFQQMIIVFSYEFMRLALVMVIKLIGEKAPLNINTYFLPAFSTAIVWPWVYYSLRQLQRRFDLR